NAPVEEAEELVERVRESKMAQLFENMQKMDIQAMRREVEAAKKELEMAQKLAKEAEQQWRKEVEQQRKEAEQQRKEAQQQWNEAAQNAERGIRVFIESCQEFALSKEEAVSRLIEKFELELEVAESKLTQYWKQ
ncbi:MAG: hypothetical protein IJ379_13910, partial [Lachnospiraceae bacterium]|nr:hypothetical protein [Lachnospiraceae bacterium]